MLAPARPCASTWIGLGAAMTDLGDLEGAESALAEANVLDSSNPNAWVHLAIVSLLAEPPREAEAERASLSLRARETKLAYARKAVRHLSLNLRRRALLVPREVRVDGQPAARAHEVQA